MFAEDLTTFFADFGEPVVLMGRQVIGVFDNAYQLADVGRAAMSSTQPTLTLPTASVPPQVVDWFSFFVEPRHPVDLHITIRRKTYQVVAHEPDGTGVSVLVLELLT